jgi:V8-like Glu-specific endopeptidase
MFFRRDDGAEPHAERGTGTLISPRHVLTAAHNVLDDLSEHGFPTGRRSPTWVFAAPGRHLQNLPFGRSKATTIRVSPEWKANAPRAKEFIDEYDYALLTLENELGTVAHQALGGRALGWWSDPKLGGGTRIRPLEPDKLARQAVNLSGYPSDKCEDRPPDRGLTFWEQQQCWTSLANRLNPQGSTQWRSFGRVVDPSPSDMRRAITYDLDSADGHSGSPVWLRWSGYRNLIAVNTSGYPGPTNEIIASLGVRITDQVVRQLRSWMREDGVTATF